MQLGCIKHLLLLCAIAKCMYAACMLILNYVRLQTLCLYMHIYYFKQSGCVAWAFS